MDKLEKDGLDAKSRLSISSRAHVVFRLHQVIDGYVKASYQDIQSRSRRLHKRDFLTLPLTSFVYHSLEEQALGKSNIGTTKRGIGPTYGTKMTRNGIRVRDLFDKQDMDSRLRLLAHNAKRLHGDLQGYDVEDEIRDMDGFREKLRPYVTDQVPLIHKLEKENAPILVEGANALMLDVDYGMSGVFGLFC